MLVVERYDKLTMTKLTANVVRNFVLSAVIIITIYVLLQSFNIGPRDIQSRTRNSLRVISQYTPESWRSHAPRITKVSSLYGEDNDLYEAAIRSHEEHDRLYGYDLKLFREKIVDSYWSLPTILMSTVVAELSKPEEERTEWLGWFGPDVFVLNPQIPLEIFLPPSDFSHAYFLGTQDQDGFNGGVFFIRVHEWSVKMLIEVLSTPKDEFQGASDKGAKALDQVLRSDQYRDHVFYQPRSWYNAYQLSTDQFEGKQGDLLVHFHGLGGDKWSAMADTISQQSESSKEWSVPLAQTHYRAETEEYWERIRTAHDLLGRARPRMFDPSIDGPLRRLQYASTYEMDNVSALNKAIDMLMEVVGSQ